MNSTTTGTEHCWKDLKDTGKNVHYSKPWSCDKTTYIWESGLEKQFPDTRRTFLVECSETKGVFGVPEEAAVVSNAWANATQKVEEMEEAVRSVPNELMSHMDPQALRMFQGETSYAALHCNNKIFDPQKQLRGEEKYVKRDSQARGRREKVDLVEQREMEKSQKKSNLYIHLKDHVYVPKNPQSPSGMVTTNSEQQKIPMEHKLKDISDNPMRASLEGKLPTKPNTSVSERRMGTSYMSHFAEK